MQTPTLNGYLERYVRSLSLNNTNSIYKLADEVNDNHRLREPLFLYALCTGKVDLLLRATKGGALHSLYSEMARSYTLSTMLSSLESNDSLLDESYHKAYNSYTCRRDMPKTNFRSKMLMHNKIKRLQKEKSVSNYRLYTDLGLNPGNVNAFLKSGDARKVSLETARKMISYLENL